MNNLRRLLFAVVILGTGMLLTGCTTPAIEATHHYTENVSSILISQDQQKVVFIGKTYHYIFDAPAGIVSTMQHPFHSKVSGNLSDFHVDSKGSVTGRYSLHIDGSLDARDRLDVSAAGYTPDANGGLTLSGTISGIRYQEDTSLVGEIKALRNPGENRDDKTAVAGQLNKTYTITVTYDPGTGEKEFDRLISPIRVTSDGLYLLFNVYLAPVLIPMAISNVTSECFPYCMMPPAK